MYTAPKSVGHGTIPGLVPLSVGELDFNFFYLNVKTKNSAGFCKGTV